MRELADHVLDLLQNAIMAAACSIKLQISEDLRADKLIIDIEDDGCGMDSEVLQRVTDPFYTSRTKKTGLGLALLAQATKMVNGSLTISSCPNQGTKVVAEFQHSHIDRAPLGNIVEAILPAITLNNLVFQFNHRIIFPNGECQEVELDTAKLKEVLGSDLNIPVVLTWIKERLTEQYQAIERSELGEIS